MMAHFLIPLPPEVLSYLIVLFMLVSQKKHIVANNQPFIYFPALASPALQPAGCWGLSQLSEADGRVTPSSLRGHCVETNNHPYL